MNPTRDGPARVRLRLGLWTAEAAAVFGAMAVSASLSREPFQAWCAALGVTMSFLHAQGAASAAEASREEPPREASSVPFVRVYYLGRELAWAVYFVAAGGWGALAGCAAFLAYPAWRAWVRRRPAGAAVADPLPGARCASGSSTRCAVQDGTATDRPSTASPSPTTESSHEGEPR